MDPNQMKAFIQNFRLEDCRMGSQGYDRVLLQFFGFMGHGKSSFINSCNFVLKGKFQVHADLGSDLRIGTKARTSYPLTNTVTLVDNRGLAKADCHESALIYAQLGNLMHLDREIAWPKNYRDIMHWIEDGDNDPNYSDFVVPVFIYSVKMPPSRTDIPNIKEVLENAERQTGIKPFVVLTNKSAGQLTSVKNIFLDMGINHVFQVENYIPEKHDRVPATDDEILTFLYKVLRDVECRMEKPRNPRRERTERKKFVLAFAHEKEVQQERDRMAAEKARAVAEAEQNKSSCTVS